MAVLFLTVGSAQPLKPEGSGEGEELMDGAEYRYLNYGYHFNYPRIFHPRLHLGHFRYGYPRPFFNRYRYRFY